ncbi:MAG: hypothetical protein R6U84_03075, partial [Candidatus Cloacimonadales bacterium]
MNKYKFLHLLWLIPLYFFLQFGYQAMNYRGLVREGSKISSSEPVTRYPFLQRLMAKLCIALPPIAIK